MTFREKVQKTKEAYDLIYDKLKAAAAQGYYYTTLTVPTATFIKNAAFTTALEVLNEQDFDIKKEKEDEVKIFWNKNSSTRSEQYKEIKNLMKQYCTEYKSVIEQVNKVANKGEYDCTVEIKETTNDIVMSKIAYTLKFIDKFEVVSFPLQKKIKIRWQKDFNFSDNIASFAASFVAAQANKLRSRVLMQIENAAKEGKFEVNVSFNEPKQLREALLEILKSYGFDIVKIQANLVIISWHHCNSQHFIYNTVYNLTTSSITEKDDKEVDQLIETTQQEIFKCACENKNKLVKQLPNTTRWVIDQVVKYFDGKEDFKATLSQSSSAAISNAYILTIEWE